jgi:hypothetical protein
MATPKKPVSKKSVPTPKATGKAVSASGVRSMEKNNIKDYEAMLDSAGDILDYPTGHRLYKQAAGLLNKYDKPNRKAPTGTSPYSGVSGRTANALSRDYNILMKAVDANKKAPVKGKALMGRKSTTPKKK